VNCFSLLNDTFLLLLHERWEEEEEEEEIILKKNCLAQTVYGEYVVPTLNTRTKKKKKTDAAPFGRDRQRVCVSVCVTRPFFSGVWLCCCWPPYGPAAAAADKSDP